MFTLSYVNASATVQVWENEKCVEHTFYARTLPELLCCIATTDDYKHENQFWFIYETLFTFTRDSQGKNRSIFGIIFFFLCTGGT